MGASTHPLSLGAFGTWQAKKTLQGERECKLKKKNTKGSIARVTMVEVTIPPQHWDGMGMGTGMGMGIGGTSFALQSCCCDAPVGFVPQKGTRKCTNPPKAAPKMRARSLFDSKFQPPHPTPHPPSHSKLYGLGSQDLGQAGGS